LANGNCKIDFNEKIDPSELQSIVNTIPTGSQIVLIHNAFPYYKDSTQSFSETDFDKSVQFVIKNSIALNKQLIPIMGDNSSIIFVGSTLSEKAVPDCLSYVILKHAQVGLMRSLAAELGERSIHTCCICPGFTDTEMLKNHAKKDLLESTINQVVFKKRLISPQEIAAFIFNCASLQISNGQVYHVNLGQW
jgi:NAD(P)-dependent dehydrogenase (short-subunit alcohol dehydrogenase family)